MKSIDWIEKKNDNGFFYMGIVPFFPCNYTVWAYEIPGKVRCRTLDSTETFDTLYDAFNYCENDFKERIRKILK